ncbi:MAG: hypothetical protein M3Q34_00825 [bacterium]|nr:hypothetical protein [bacterium]
MKLLIPFGLAFIFFVIGWGIDYFQKRKDRKRTIDSQINNAAEELRAWGGGKRRRDAEGR